MSAILTNEMRAGAIGLSSGLEYDPGIYSIAPSSSPSRRSSAPFGGRYISHIRSEDYAFWQAIDEIIAHRARGEAPRAGLAREARHAVAVGPRRQPR